MLPSVVVAKLEEPVEEDAHQAHARAAFAWPRLAASASAASTRAAKASRPRAAPVRAHDHPLSASDRLAAPTSRVAGSGRAVEPMD